MTPAMQPQPQAFAHAHQGTPCLFGNNTKMHQPLASHITYAKLLTKCLKKHAHDIVQSRCRYIMYAVPAVLAQPLAMSMQLQQTLLQQQGVACMACSLDTHASGPPQQPNVYSMPTERMHTMLSCPFQLQCVELPPEPCCIHAAGSSLCTSSSSSVVCIAPPIVLHHSPLLNTRSAALLEIHMHNNKKHTMLLSAETQQPDTKLNDMCINAHWTSRGKQWAARPLSKQCLPSSDRKKNETQGMQIQQRVLILGWLLPLESSPSMVTRPTCNQCASDKGMPEKNDSPTRCMQCSVCSWAPYYYLTARQELMVVACML
jgi:hypothetical protein